MRRMVLPMLLTAGFFFLASGIAVAQRHGGGPAGPANPGNAVQAPAVKGGAPAVRNEAPAIRNERPAISGERPNEHPFYGKDHGRENEWRYGFHNNRWWYWMPGNKWSYWNDGQWQAYAEPYTANYRGPVSASPGWFWSNDQHQWYWFDGSTLQAAQQ